MANKKPKYLKTFPGSPYPNRTANSSGFVDCLQSSYTLDQVVLRACLRSGTSGYIALPQRTLPRIEKLLRCPSTEPFFGF